MGNNKNINNIINQDNYGINEDINSLLIANKKNGLNLNANYNLNNINNLLNSQIKNELNNFYQNGNLNKNINQINNNF